MFVKIYKPMRCNTSGGTRNIPAVKLPTVVHVVHCSPKRASYVLCAASKAKASKARKAAPSGKGFGSGKAPKQQESWEKELIPSYRVYYKPGFKPPRFQGPIELKRFEDGSVGVVASEGTNGAELLVVSHPIAFLEGTLGAPPSVEDLHVSLLEAELSPSVTKVLSYLPRRPVANAAAAAKSVPVVERLAGAADSAAGTAAAVGPNSQQHDLHVQQPATEADEKELPPSFAHVLVQFWDQVGTFAVNKLSSKQLMRMLQASCWSEEVQDPAASQVRHERPTSFIGIWPEFAFMRHSCTPNTSVVVVDRYMLLHATDDIPAGREYTVNKLGSVIAAPLAARQAAHQEMFGRPCCCSRCQLEQQLTPEVAQQLQSTYDRAQDEWPNRLQKTLEAAEEANPETTAELLNDIQGEVAAELASLDEALSEATPDPDDKRCVLCGVYAAYDLAWQMEELLQETPDLDKLANCVALLRLFARGSEGHVYTAMALDELYSSRAQVLSEEATRMKRKTMARQRQLTLQIQQLVAAAQAAAFANAEAITCRYGMLPEEGLIPQLQQGLTMFYAGLSALSAARGEGLDEVPEITRNLTIDGIPVTVVDTVEGSAFAGDEGSEVGRPSGAAAGQRMKVDWLEAQQEDGRSEDSAEAAALEAAAESALAAAVAQLEAQGAAGQLTASG